MAVRPVSDREFFALLDGEFAAALEGVEVVALALSGGPDSMALAALLSKWAAKKGIIVHALTVDHGLRTESSQEAKAVGKAVKGWPHFRHAILSWEGDKPQNRIMEAARAARYELMATYCRSKHIRYLFVAHHQDDQAETFLFRLAKGSGLDGLAGMQAIHPYGEDMVLLRPFLDICKERLIKTCEARKLFYVNDPTNTSSQFARPRLREARAVLDAEGLTAKRLATTMQRLVRAKKTLDQIAAKVYKTNVLEENTKHIVFNYAALHEWPEDIVFRVMLMGVRNLSGEGDYLPRMESLEAVLADVLSPVPFRKRTLGGLVFSRDDKRGLLILDVEES